jgi:23S rRNA (uridine2552-2'-O)-methyltransferase
MGKPRKTSGSWRDRQERDPYVQKARRDGWRSRAVYKLEQIDEKERFLRPDMVCVDVGSAPGSWSQYVTRKLKGRARIVAVDILPMDSLPDVEFIQGDFQDEAVFEQMLTAIGDEGVDLVMSDIAPNITGTRVVDQPRSMYLVELALDFARRVLKPGGSFVCKVFQGEGIDEFVIDTRNSFVLGSEKLSIVVVSKRE